MIEKVVLRLAEKFPEFEWDLQFTEGVNKYCILVNDFDFYFKDKRFKNMLKVLRKKYPDVKFYCAYKNFKHE